MCSQHPQYCTDGSANFCIGRSPAGDIGNTGLSRTHNLDTADPQHGRVEPSYNPLAFGPPGFLAISKAPDPHARL